MQSPLEDIISRLTTQRREAEDAFLRRVFSKCLLMARREKLRWQAEQRLVAATLGGRKCSGSGAGGGFVPATLDGQSDQSLLAFSATLEQKLRKLHELGSCRTP